MHPYVHLYRTQAKMTESKLLLCVTILVYSMVVEATLEVFDVDKVEANSGRVRSSYST